MLVPYANCAAIQLLVICFRDDPLDRVTNYIYDDLGRLLQEELPDPDGVGALGRPTTTYTYDEVGRRLGLIDPVGNMTSWTYDVHGWVLTDTNELSDTRSFEYDAVGNLVERTDRLGRVIDYTFDDLDRVTTEEWLDSMSSPIYAFSYSYDANGRLLEATDPAATYTYEYDNLRRRISEEQDLDGLAPTIEYVRHYDENSRLSQLATTLGGTADLVNDYVYDKLGRRTQQTQQAQSGGSSVAEKRFDFAYEADGRFSSITKYADVAGTEEIATTDFGYDGLRRLTSLLHHKVGTDFAGYEYVYDVAGQIEAIDSLVDGLTEYTYDGTGQLTDADHASQADEAYEYDENGNRVMSGHAVGDNNQLLSDGTYDYEYDDEGNRTARDNISTGERTEYEWDYRNRLVKVTEKDSLGAVTQTVEQHYDYLNRWVRSEIDADGAGVGTAVDRFFSYDDNQIALVFDGSAASDLANRYSWGPMVDQILADEQVTSLVTVGNVLTPLTDHLNTVRDLADRNESTGAVTVADHKVYNSFGELTSQTNALVTHHFAFTGRYFEVATGLSYHTDRWLDGKTGEWLTDDPIGFDGDRSNLGRYVSNSPINKTDPTGRCEVTLPIPDGVDIEALFNEIVRRFPSLFTPLPEVETPYTPGDLPQGSAPEFPGTPLFPNGYPGEDTSEFPGPPLFPKGLPPFDFPAPPIADWPGSDLPHQSPPIFGPGELPGQSPPFIPGAGDSDGRVIIDVPKFDDKGVIDQLRQIIEPRWEIGPIRCRATLRPSSLKGGKFNLELEY